MAIYSRSATCGDGHAVKVSFEWDPQQTGGPKEYSEACPVTGCGGRVAGKLPIGADPETLELSPGAA